MLTGVVKVFGVSQGAQKRLKMSMLSKKPISFLTSVYGLIFTACLRMNLLSNAELSKATEYGGR